MVLGDRTIREVWVPDELKRVSSTRDILLTLMTSNLSNPPVGYWVPFIPHTDITGGLDRRNDTILKSHREDLLTNTKYCIRTFWD